MISKLLKEKIKSLLYYGKITRKYRYSNPIKDKAWTLLSDYTRMRDFLRWKTCVSCGKFIPDWTLSDAGHFVSMASNGALIGFSEFNVHMQCKHCNMLGSFDLGARYAKELERRYKSGILEVIQTQKQTIVKADDWFFLERIEDLYDNFKSLKEEFPYEEFPEYMNV